MNHVHPSIVQQKDKELAILEELVNKLIDKIEKLENIVAMYKAQADYVKNEGENK